MKCPGLVGRDLQLTELRALLEGAAGGRGSWVNVEGEAGVGKSRLVEEFTADLPAALWGRTSLVDEVTPYRPLLQVLLRAVGGSHRRPEGAAAAYAAVLAPFVPGWDTAPVPDVVAAPALVGESVLQVVVQFVGVRPIVVVLEDLHWADPETAAACVHLADQLAAMPVLVVATFRAEEIDDVLANELRRHPTIGLAPLDGAGVAEMATRCLGDLPNEERLEGLLAGSGGLPLLVEELLEGRPGPGVRFSQLVRGRFEVLSPAARDVVVAASLVGEDVARSLLDEVSDQDAVAEALAGGLLVAGSDGVVRFRHARTHEVVTELAWRDADRMAASVAPVLERTGGGQALLRAAELWVRAGDKAAAVRVLRDVAASREARRAPSLALAALTRAGELVEDPGQRRSLDVARLQLLVDLGRVEDAKPFAAELADRPTGDEGAKRRIRLLQTKLALASGEIQRARRLLDQEPRAPAGADEVVLRAELALREGGGSRRVEAEHLAHQAVATAEADGEADVAIEALGVAARCARGRSLAAARELLERALVLAEEHALVARRVGLLNELGTVEMLEIADGARLHRARDAALAAGALDVAAGVELNLASLHAMRNELADARSMAEQARVAALRVGLAPLAAAAMVVDAVTYGFVGDADQLERRLREARDLSLQDSDLDAFASGAGRGLCALVREDRLAARDAFARAWRADPPLGVLDTARAPLLLLDAVDGTATKGDRDVAHEVAVPGAGWSDLWLGYADAALHGATGRPAAAVETFEGAEAAGRRHPLFRAICLRLVSEAAMRDGWGDPVGWLRDAEATFVSGGQYRIAGACRALLAQAGVATTRRRGADRALPSELLAARVTAREAEVLDLVAERLGNKEIAARLYLSPRTVEKHVASLLTKLEVRDRTYLARLARERR